MPVGVVTERVDTEQGMMFSAKISATTLGNDALVMAQDGTIDQSLHRVQRQQPGEG